MDLVNLLLQLNNFHRIRVHFELLIGLADPHIVPLAQHRRVKASFARLVLRGVAPFLFGFVDKVYPVIIGKQLVFELK